MKSPRMKVRDAEATKDRILTAARAEFATLGLGGARIDKIAAEAQANKQMIYHYFGSKDELFTAALEAEYAQFREAEAALELERVDPVEALKELVGFTWRYYIAFPGFISMVNSANLHQARHLKHSETFRHLNRPFLERMRRIIARGLASGQFREGLDPAQVQITIAGLGYHYLTNRFTGTLVFERDLTSAKALEQRLAFNTTTILRLVCTPKVLAKMEKLTCTA